MEIVIAAISIVALLMVLSLRKRVQHLEDSIMSRGVTHAPSLLREGELLSPTIQNKQPSTPSAFITWLQEDWLLKVGALLLLIGFGWLARYAFLNNWIGPAGRITLGIVGGVLLLVLGWWRMQTYAHQGGIFLALGSGVILLTVFAARFLYDFFTPLSALSIMFLSTAFVALASVRSGLRSLSLVSLALAGAAPLLTHATQADYVGLFYYLVIVVVGATWVVVITGWRVLTPAALVLVTLYSVQHLVGLLRKDIDVLLLFAYAFTAIFFLTNVLASARSEEEDPRTDAITAAGVGLFLLAWVVRAASDEWQSLIMVSWMIVFSAGAFFVLRATGKRSPFFAYLAVSVALLASATAAELDGAALTIAYSIESALVSLVIYGVLRDTRLALGSTILLVGPAALSLQSITAFEWQSSILHDHFFVLLLLALVPGALGIFFASVMRKAEIPNKHEDLYQIAPLLIVGGSLYAYALLWLSLHAGFKNDDIAVMIALAVYTVLGIAAYLYQGFSVSADHVRIYGALLLGFVVGRLLIVDVWKMALTGRIITFFLIGILLMSTAFFWRKEHGDPHITRNSLV